MNVENDAKDNSEESIDSELVESASRFLVRLLRHKPEEYGIHLNSRGWTSEKDVRRVLTDEFDEVVQKKESRIATGSVELIHEVLSEDEENRFQRIVEDRAKYGFIRATRKHTAEEVNLLEVHPDKDALSWFVVTAEGENPVYVEAVDEDAAKRLLVERANISADLSEATVTNLDEVDSVAPHIDKNPYFDRTAGTEVGVSDSLSGPNPPFVMFHQDTSKPFKVEKRVNQAGDKGRYFTSHSYRVRERTR